MIKETVDKYVMNTYKRKPIVIEKGEGVYLTDEEGKTYLDFASGIAVNALGYGNKDFAEALKAQSLKFNHCSNLFYNAPQARLAKLLIENSCFDKVFFCNSGAESTESALKLAKKYGNETGRKTIIAMKNSFHGRTLGSLSLTGQTKYQNDFLPVVPNIIYAEFNNIQSVKDILTDDVCAIITEPIQGEGGLRPAEKEFLNFLRKTADEKDVVLIFDEVQTGIGRCGELFCFQTYEVKPDVICLAKGLGNGFPIGAIMAKGKFANILTQGNHASTFGGNPLASVCAEFTLNEILNKNILKNVRETGKYFFEKLNDLKEKYNFIKDVRGKGFMLGMEFDFEVADIIDKCMEKGLLLISAGSNILRFVPPLIINKEETDKGLNILEEVLKEIYNNN